MQKEIRSKTIVDIIMERYPDETWETIIPKLSPVETKELHEVMDTLDTLFKNGMFNLDDEDDYIRKGFDIMTGWEDEVTYQNNLELLAAWETDTSEGC